MSALLMDIGIYALATATVLGLATMFTRRRDRRWFDQYRVDEKPAMSPEPQLKADPRPAPTPLPLRSAPRLSDGYPAGVA